jgi:hypothetical protein
VEFTYLFLELLVLEHLVRPVEHCSCADLRLLADWSLLLLFFIFLSVVGDVDLESRVVDPNLDVVRFRE